MSDDSLIDAEIDKRKKMALSIGGGLVALEIMMLLTYRSYLDFGHLFLAILYIATTFVVYWSLRRAKLIPAIVGTLFAVALLSAGIAKVKWNEGYLQALTTPDAFIFEDYIEEYPTLEQHLFSDLLGRPDWIGFAKDCGIPAMREKPIPQICRTPESIKALYRLDITEEMQKFLKRMQKTAQDVKDGRIQAANQYQRCIADRRCAPIPLLPEEAKQEEVTENSTQYVDIRKAFWDLAERKGLTFSVCPTMRLCDILMKTGVVSFKDVVPGRNSLSDQPAEGPGSDTAPQEQ